ncbi:kinase-like domain-containing protein [Nemania serpens]|nr:kinase-like domain-containing protein [Nemania serpens]
MLDYGFADNGYTVLIEEARIYEKLRLHPHKNIVQYHGCMAENGMFHAICLDRYPATLQEREENLSEAEKKRIVQEIRDGVAHLHSIGLVHNDLNPRNIMIAEDGTAVIIDFDSCRPTGERMGPKGATPGWDLSTPGEYATPQNDLHNLDQIEQSLLGHPVA